MSVDLPIHALTDGVAPAATDEFYVVRSPFGTGDDRKVTWAELLLAIGRYNVTAYGAVPNSSAGAVVAANRVAFQNAINAAYAAGGGVVYVPAGTWWVGASGSTLSGRPYSLLLKSGVTLMGDSSQSTTIKLATNANCEAITTDTTTTSTNIEIKGITVDGNDTNQSSKDSPGYFNLWLKSVTGLVLEDVRSINSSNWACRVELCTRVHIDGYEANNGPDLNADGLHFLDTSQVTGGDIWIYTEGDDGLIIEAVNQNVTDYALSGIYVQEKHTSVSAGLRAVLLMADPAVVTGGRTISDVNLEAVTVKGNAATGGAVNLTGASFRNVHVSSVSDGCTYDLVLSPGVTAGAHGTFTGTMWGCEFDIVGANSASTSIVMSSTDATGAELGYRNNRIDAIISNPGDGYAGAYVVGNGWKGSINVDYDPNGTKASKQQGIVLYDDLCDLTLFCRDADVNIQVQGTATNNTIRLGQLSGGVTYDLSILAGAANNRFVGGRVTAGKFNNAATILANQFDSVLNLTFYGQVSLNFATLANGTATFAHGLAGTPVYVNLQLSATGVSYVWLVKAADGTNITVELRNSATGAAITTGTYTFYYEAAL